MRASILAFASAVMLLSAGCASASSGFDLQKLESATQADLAAAKADADAHGDKIASQCYAGVSAYITANPLSAPSVGAVNGVASAFQVGRDVVKLAESAQTSAGIPTALELACGPLALDVQSDLGKATSQLTILGIKF